MSVVGCLETLLTGLGNMVPDHIPTHFTGHIPDLALAVGGCIVFVDQLDSTNKLNKWGQFFFLDTPLL